MTQFFKIAALAALSLVALAAAPAQAQLTINVNTAPPVVANAPADAQYYYVPEIKGYYDVPARQYVVLRNGQWMRVERVEGYDPRNFHPRYHPYRGASPWLYQGQGKKGHPHGMPPGQAKKLYRQGYGQPVFQGNREDDDDGYGKKDKKYKKDKKDKDHDKDKERD